MLDSLKCLQLPLDNTIGPLYSVNYDITNENHVLMTMDHCRLLDYYEQKAPDLIGAICHGCHRNTIEAYLLNPQIKVIPIKLPPRESQDDMACQWEFKIE